MERVLLNHRSGSREGQCEIYPIARFQSLYFGRGSDCDVRFSTDGNLMVSRSHAVLEWDRGKPRLFTLTDLVSSNGTFVNGKRVDGMVRLAEGDELQLGEGGPVVSFTIESDESVPTRRKVTQSIKKVDVSEGIPDTVLRPLPSGRSKPAD